MTYTRAVQQESRPAVFGAAGAWPLSAPLALILAAGMALRLRLALASSAQPSFSLVADAANALVSARAGVAPRAFVGPGFAPIVAFVTRFGEARDAMALGVVTSLFDLAGALVLMAVATRIGLSPIWRLLVVSAFFLAPATVSSAVSGLPTSLAVLSMLVLLHATIADGETVRLARVPGRTTGAIVAAVVAMASSWDLVVPIALVGGVALARKTPRAATRIAIPTVLALAAVALFATVTLVGVPRWLPGRDTVEALRFTRLPRMWGALPDGLTESARRSRGAIEASWLSVKELGADRSSGVLALGASIMATFVLPDARRTEVVRRLRAVAPIALGAFLLLAARGGLGIAGSRDAVLARALVLLAIASPLDVATAELPAPRRSLAIAALVVVFTVLGFSSHGTNPARVAARGAPVTASGETTGITAPWYRAKDGAFVDLEGVTGGEGREAVRRGELLAYARRLGVRRLYVDARWQGATFFGPRYRESLRTDPSDPTALLVVRDPAEKDEVIHIPSTGIDLGSLAGREFLSDGWRWVARPSSPARSIGAVSEIVFALGADRSAAVLELSVASVPKLRHDEQEISLWIDDTFVVRRNVPAQPTIVRVPMLHATAGRHRLRIFHTDPSPAKTVTSEDDENEQASIEVGFLRVAPVPELPPRGPSLGAPGGGSILAAGFLRLEGTGEQASVWAVGPRADLAFTVTDVDRDHVLLLEAGPPPASSEGDDQHVTLRLDGVVVGTAHLVQGPLVVSRFTIPHGVLRDGENHLTLTYSRTAHDDVDRALYVRSVRLE
jgi:hypothetical protein